MLSIVIPVHNEEPSILPLYDRLSRVLQTIRKPYEIIFVDDASTDGSFGLLSNLVGQIVTGNLTPLLLHPDQIWVFIPPLIISTFINGGMSEEDIALLNLSS